MKRMTNMKPLVIMILAMSAPALSGCAAVAVGAAGTAVGVAAVQEGGLSRAASDTGIQTQINDLWFRHDVEMFRKLSTTVREGRVLITGVVQKPEHRVEAVRLAWQVNGVTQVINEIKVADSEGLVGFSRDTWISTRLRSAITLDSQISSLNYTIDTVQGTVYLMGFANSQQELNRVIEKARTISNVRNVVSYVRVAGAPTPTGSSSGRGEAWGRPQDDYDYRNQRANTVQQNTNQQQQQGLTDSDFAQPYGTSGGGAPVAPVATGEPIDWGNDSYNF